MKSRPTAKRKDGNAVCIIGGGASGLTAAITAAREGAEVTLLEHNEKTGRKLLATGNGRCNLSNLQQKPEYYNSQTPEAAWRILQNFSLEQTISFFSSIGVPVRSKNDYLYPSSMQAASVQKLLEMEAKYQGAAICCHEHVQKLQPEHHGFTIVTETRSYTADTVILACGSKASAIRGADGSGYALAEAMGHSLVPCLPALVPLKGHDLFFSKWAGVRVEGTVSLWAKGRFWKKETGEIQLTDYGISGIPVFQISGKAVQLLEEGAAVMVFLDFMPDMGKKGLEKLLWYRKKQCPYKSDSELLLGMLPEKLIDMLLEGKPDRKTLIERIKEFQVPIAGAVSMEKAQVCSGGVSLREVHTRTMESKKTAGLFLAGELLDVDGICGGYNLQWAWTTGALAGKYAALKHYD